MRRSGRCPWCHTQMVMTRVDRGDAGRMCDDERGLGIPLCPVEECRASHDDWCPRCDAEMSGGRAFVDHLKKHAATQGRYGKWTVRHDGYVHTALRLAIVSGMEFFPWDGEFLAFTEHTYGLACTTTGTYWHHDRNPANVRAARAMEHMWGRPPFILQGKRLCVTSAFTWADAGATVHVTSFRSKGEGAGAAHYVNCARRKPGADGQNEAFFKITPAELRTAAKSGKAKWGDR